MSDWCLDLLYLYVSISKLGNLCVTPPINQASVALVKPAQDHMVARCVKIWIPYNRKYRANHLHGFLTQEMKALTTEEEHWEGNAHDKGTDEDKQGMLGEAACSFPAAQP